MDIDVVNNNKISHFKYATSPKTTKNILPIKNDLENIFFITSKEALTIKRRFFSFSMETLSILHIGILPSKATKALGPRFKNIQQSFFAEALEAHSNASRDFGNPLLLPSVLRLRFRLISVPAPTSGPDQVKSFLPSP